MNQVLLDGWVGKIDRKNESVHLRLNHNRSYHDKKTNEWKKVEDWFSVTFFGKRGDAAERSIRIGNHIIIEGSLTTWPKDGPTSRMRIEGFTFHIIERRDKPRGEENEEQLWEEASIPEGTF